jgi:hypothetical protein
MKYTIDYYWIDYGAHLFATPTYQKSENVECSSEENLRKYIESQKDAYGGFYKKNKKKFMGYDYISSQGGVKVRRYEEPKFKKPTFKKI